MLLTLLAFLAVFGSASSTCDNRDPGKTCNKDCCSLAEELIHLEITRDLFYEVTTAEVEDLLSHDYPEKIFYDLFWPGTPIYAISPGVVAAAKNGDFDNEELINYELERRTRTNSFATKPCKSTFFISEFIKVTKRSWKNSHAIYRALRVADKIKEEIISFPLKDECLESVFKAGLFGEHSCNSCGEDKVVEIRTCTSLCENVVNGCYYMLMRVLGDQYDSFKEVLGRALEERAYEEVAKRRNQIEMFILEEDVLDAAACTGFSQAEVEYRLERLIMTPRVGRNHYFSNAFRLLLTSPKAAIPKLMPIRPNAEHLCRNQAHLPGNTDCFNGSMIGVYSVGTHEPTAAGQESNEFKSYGGSYSDYLKLESILAELKEITEELEYQSNE